MPNTIRRAADTPDEVVFTGAWAQVLTLAKTHGPMAVIAACVVSGVGAALYNGCQWIGVHVVTPITDQHVATLQVIQKTSVDQATALKAIEEGMRTLANAMRDQNDKLDKILRERNENDAKHNQ